MSLPDVEKTSPRFRDPAQENDLVLFCLSQEEMDWFFKGALPSLPNARSHYLDTGDAKTTDFGAFLKKRQPSVIVSCWSTPPLPVAYLENPGRKLRYLCHVTGSVRSVCPPELFRHNIRVSNWGDMASATVSEQALLLILSCLRRAPRWRGCFFTPVEEQTHYRIGMQTQSLRGKRVGIHGFGRIARHLIELLRPFHVSVSAYSKGVPDSFMVEHGARPCRSLQELFCGNDIIVECEALTPENEGSITRELLESMPEDATFINVGRGQIVDEVALTRLAASGRLRVGLDVYATEPVPFDSELLRVQDAVLSPHIAGPTHDHFEKCGKLALANVQRYLNGQTPEFTMNLQQYERST